MGLKLSVLIVATGTIISGCAGQQIKFEEVPANKYVLPYSKVLVEDFTHDKKVSANDVVYVNGWVPLFDGTRGPSPNKTFYRYLSATLAPRLGGDDTLRVALVNSEFLMDSIVTDTVVFISFISAQRERTFKCTASLSISNNAKAERKEFEVAERASGFVEMEFLQAFVTRCRRQLAENIGTYLKQF